MKLKVKKPLVLTTCMAPNMDFFCWELAGYITKRTDLPTRLILDVPWQERERLLDAGSVDLCWICGLPYVQKADQSPGKLLPLVAPVMAARRYHDQPVYYSDVVVHRDSPYYHFADLHGASWAYNEPNSHSGYGVVRYELARLGENFDFFTRVVESGSHQTSLSMIMHKEVDASAIDSTVLEMELANHPEYADSIRVVDTFGPSPIPPWITSERVLPSLRDTLQELLTQMHTTPEGLAILKAARVSRFAVVDDKEYDPIREMAHLE